MRTNPLFPIKHPFDGPGGVRRSDPATSHAAANDVPVNKLENMFLKALRGGPRTTLEIAVLYGMDRDSFSPRSRRLLKVGWIKQVGVKQARNKAGRLKSFNVYALRTPDDPTPIPPLKPFTQKDLRLIETALNMVAADAWDEDSYGPRPDWETLIAKVQSKIK